MGIFPITCAECGDSYVSSSSNTHCKQLARDIKENERRRINDHDLLRKIIIAFKEHGEASQEILDAAYEYGYSVSRTQIKWLDVEIPKMVVQSNGCSKVRCKCKEGFHAEDQCRFCKEDKTRPEHCKCGRNGIAKMIEGV